MAYCTLDNLLDYLGQLRGDESKEDVLNEVIDRAAALINLDLGVTEDLTPAAVGTQVVYGDGTRYLTPEGPVSAITNVTAPVDHTVPSYIVRDNIIVINGDHTSGLSYPLASLTGYSGWYHNIAYTVHATFGYSPRTMKALEEANLQIAVRLWRFKDSGGAEFINAETGSLEVRQQFSPMVKDILRLVNQERRGVGGVW